MSKLKILVTGASGMTGFHAAKHLLTRGHYVRALVRKSSNTENLRRLQCGTASTGVLEIVVSELTDEAGLLKACKDIDIVVHAAGVVDPLGSREEIYATNVKGTGAVLTAAIAAGAKQFILISSLSVITGQGDQYAVSEKADLKYCGEAYADSKVDAEKLVMAEAGKGKISVTSLRPGFIYGPGERAWMPRIINSISTGKAMLIDDGVKESNVIYIGNLCRAIEASLLNPAAFNQVYNLTDGQKITKKQLFDAIADGLGQPRVTRSVPGPIARIVCEIASTIAPMLAVETQRKMARFSRAAFRLAGLNQGFDISKAERDLGYTKRIPFAEGMQQTLLYFKGKTSGDESAAPPRDLAEV